MITAAVAESITTQDLSIVSSPIYALAGQFESNDDLDRAVNYVKEAGDPALVKMIELSFACKKLPNLDVATRTDPMIVVKLKR